MDEQTKEIPLTKRERREQARLARKQEAERAMRGRKIKNALLTLVTLAILIFAIRWVWQEATRPLPGREVEDLDRDHVTDTSNTTYNSDPPTSGSHFAIWAKRGVYDRVIADGYLLHSLEHGYVIISYNCDKLPQARLRLGSPIFAHETDTPHEEPVSTESASPSAKPLTKMKLSPQGEMAWFTPENPPPKEIELPESFRSPSCDALVERLTTFLVNAQRLIIVPRPGMDALLALTAWGRIDIMDSVDESRIQNFIKAYHNQGPERTVE